LVTRWRRTLRRLLRPAGAEKIELARQAYAGGDRGEEPLLRPPFGTRDLDFVSKPLK